MIFINSWEQVYLNIRVFHRKIKKIFALIFIHKWLKIIGNEIDDDYMLHIVVNINVFAHQLEQEWNLEFWTTQYSIWNRGKFLSNR